METVKKVFDLAKVERYVNDMIHTSIPLYEPISSIIDTPEFQRMRKIKQLSLSELIYPSANHNRFIHSVGVYHLACRVASQLLSRNPDKLDARDVLCVSIAGLIHDLGHGPFSHLFDGPFLEATNPGCTWKHEDGSKAMFRHLLFKNPEVKKSLDQYLEERDYIFIDELITPPKEFLDSEENWMLKGRPIEKSFLYDIISNKHDGLDVDKMDYFLRDSKCTGVDIVFSKDRFERLLTHMDICFSKRFSYNRIAYSGKVRDDCKSTFESRIHLHRDVYKHKTVFAIEAQVIEILVLADPFLKFIGSNGEVYQMSTSINDMEAYSKVTDTVLDMIRLSSDDNLKKAKQLLDDLEHRRIYRYLGNIRLYEEEKEEDTVDAVEKIQDFLAQSGLKEAEYIIKTIAIHEGLGVRNDPMERICFFNSDKIESYLSFPLGAKSPGFYCIFIYLRSYKRRPGLKRKFSDFLSKTFNPQQTIMDIQTLQRRNPH